MRESPPKAAHPGASAAPGDRGLDPSRRGAAGARAWPTFDREGLERARSGDSEALGLLFDRCFDPVYALAHRFTGQRDAAQDITQEVLLKVRRHLPRLDLDTDLGPWLFTVTANACRDHRRSAWWKLSRRTVELDGEADQASLARPLDGPEQILVAAEERRRVQLAVHRLPEALRMSVILHDFEGMPHEQIARLTGTSHAAARQRHARAMRALTRLLLAEEES